MFLIRCPYCDEERPELEFRHCGEAHIVRPQNMAELSDSEFESYYFVRRNAKGVVFERWRHIHGCARFFNAARHSVSDRFIMTYRAGDPMPELSGEQVEAAMGGPAISPATSGSDGVWKDGGEPA